MQNLEPVVAVLQVEPVVRDQRDDAGDGILLPPPAERLGELADDALPHSGQIYADRRLGGERGSRQQTGQSRRKQRLRGATDHAPIPATNAYAKLL